MPSTTAHFSDCVAADSPELLETAFRLRHTAYTTSGYIRPVASGMESDEFDAIPASRTLVFRGADRALGTVRLLPDSPAGLWANHQGFAPELARLRRCGRHIVEAGKLAFPGQETPRQAMLEVLKQLTQAALELGGDDLIITVQPKCVGFYERFAGFRRVSDRAVTYATYPPVVLLRLDLSALANHRVAARKTA